MASSECCLNDKERRLIEFATQNDLNGLKALIVQNNLSVDVYDSQGMTPLKHAAYKGNKEICQLLLDHGANVNCMKHEHEYTSLHFAALSGNAELCQLLLEAGAKSHPTNSVGRTPSQMAAFVGNYNCVAVINNFIPKSEIDYFSVPHGLETEPKLPFIYASPLHKFVMQVNINPVRVALNLIPTLVSNLKTVKSVLELMSEHQMKRGAESNEVMSFKLHYLSCIIEEVIKCKSPEKQSDPVEVFVRKVLVKKRGDEYVELLIREIVREFSFRECMIFRQMVTSLANTKEVGSALSIIKSCINGQRAFADESKPCATCGEEKANKKCSKCKEVQYCDRECQRLHWFLHKKECNRNSDDLSSKMDGIKVN